jgi:hypothetical protein
VQHIVKDLIVVFPAEGGPSTEHDEHHYTH